MRSQPVGLRLLSGLAIVVAACGGGSSQSSSTATVVISTAPSSTAPSSQPSAPATTAVTSDLKIAVITGIGTLKDQGDNEYAFMGAEAGAIAIGAAAPRSMVPTAAADYGPSIMSFIDQRFDVIVTVGSDLATATVQAAHDNPDTWFIGVGQSPICVTAKGLPDAKSVCKGDAKALLPHYISLQFQEDQAGYLAGIVAAGVTKTGEIGAIGGSSLCVPCVRYIQGYELGARSVKPGIKVDVAYVTDDLSAAAFQDPAGGKAFAEDFLARNKDVDVLFHAARLTGNGILEAACAAVINGIGVDVDQFVSFPTAAPCLLTSATKNLQSSVSDAIKAIEAGNATPGDSLQDARNDGIGVAPGRSRGEPHDIASAWADDTQGRLDAALAAMRAGTLKTCPDDCGSPA